MIFIFPFRESERLSRVSTGPYHVSSHLQRCFLFRKHIFQAFRQYFSDFFNLRRCRNYDHSPSYRRRSWAVPGSGFQIQVNPKMSSRWVVWCIRTICNPPPTIVTLLQGRGGSYLAGFGSAKSCQKCEILDLSMNFPLGFWIQLQIETHWDWNKCFIAIQSHREKVQCCGGFSSGKLWKCWTITWKELRSVQLVFVVIQTVI